MPSAPLDPGTGRAPVRDVAVPDSKEEPDPPSARRPGPSAGLAAACLPLLLGNRLLAGDRCLASGDGLPIVEIAAQVSPLHVLIATAAAALGCFGAVTSASLLAHSPTRLAQYLDEKKRPDKDARTRELEAHDTEFFVVAATYAAAGWVLGLWALQHAVDTANLPWAVGSWLLVMLLVAGSLPAAVADARAERAVIAGLPLLRAGWLLLRWPLVKPLLATTRLLVRVLRLQRSPTADPAEVQKQIMAAVADSVDDDELAADERTWIGNIVTLKDQQVSTVMTPRPDIVALPESISLRDAVDQALEHEFSRYPVYRERIDEVVGIFYVKDALRLLRTSPDKLDETPLRTLLRDPLFVPETTSAAQLLRRVQAGNQHMAIVIDEYGTTVGLATVEDLVEEIVGEIGDEYDPPSEQDAEIRVVEAGRVVEIPARTSVDEVNRLLGTQLSEDGDWETVAGLVIASCNRIPAVGETVVVDHVEFRVLEADERRVQRLRLTALEGQPAESK